MNILPYFVCKARCEYICTSFVRMSSILVYSGKGSKTESISNFIDALQDTVDLTKHEVKFTSADEVKAGLWTSNTKLFCIGGGYDLGYIESLGDIGMRLIREFVNNGGSFLGICAGAYFACDFIEFDKDGPLEVIGERSLKFYNGKCIGPAYAGFDYNTKKGVVAAPIVYKNMELNAYFEGGGLFLPYKNSSQRETKVLGNYKCLDNTPAVIVKCRRGKGTVLLSGVHIEYSSHCLNDYDQYIRKVLPQLINSERKRKFVFRDMLKTLGIVCVQNDEVDSVSWL